MTVSDHDLMQQSGQGDPEAFETLVRRWEKPVGRFLLRLTGSNSRHPAGDVDDDDLSQEVFLRVLLAGRRYRNHCAFSTWLYRIALNVARDAARRQKSRQKLINNHQLRRDNKTNAPPETLSQKEIENHAAEALKQLPSKQREPLVLRHYADLSFAETAEVLGIPLSTAKSRVRAGLESLRIEMKRRGIDEREFET